SQIKPRVQALHLLNNARRFALEQHLPRILIDVSIRCLQNIRSQQSVLLLRSKRAKPHMMTRARVILHAGYTAARFIVKRKIFGLYREQADQWLDYSRAQQARNTRINFCPTMAAIHRITGKQFVATVATQGDSYMLARK